MINIKLYIYLIKIVSKEINYNFKNNKKNNKF